MKHCPTFVKWRKVETVTSTAPKGLKAAMVVDAVMRVANCNELNDVEVNEPSLDSKHVCL